MRSLVVAWCLIASFRAFSAEAPIFPQPLHLSLETSDSISGTTHRIDEYFEGNRVIAVAGARTVVTDYAAQTITQIDRAAGTYSVAPFSAVGSQSAAKGAGTWKSREVAPQTIAGHAVEVFELESSLPGDSQRVRIASTADVKLSRVAAEVLIGANYPAHSERGETLLATLRIRAVTASATNAAMYRLPLETVITYEVAGEFVEAKSVVTGVTSRRAPVELASIPAGARQVEPPPDPAAALYELERPSARR